MTALAIARWHNTYLTQHGLQEDTLSAWEHSLYDIDLGREIDALVGADALVFVRAVHLQTRLNAQSTPSMALGVWRDALLQQLNTALQHEHHTNVVRYEHRREALTDLLYRCCAGDGSRLWVGQQLQLVRGGESLDALRRAIVAELQTQPQNIWPIVGHLLRAEPRCAAFTCVIQGLPRFEMEQLLVACPQTRVFVPLMDEAGTSGAEAATSSSVELQHLLHWVQQHTCMMPLHRRTLLLLAAAAALPATPGHEQQSPDGRLRDLLASAEQLIRTTEQRGAVPTATGRLRRALPTPGPLLPSAPHGSDATFAPPEPETEADPLPPAPALPQACEPLPTAWGGLLFLLNILPRTSWLDRLQRAGEPSASDQSAPDMSTPGEQFRLLWSLATVNVGIPGTDPVVKAFCGGWQPAAADLDSCGRLRLHPRLQAVRDEVAHDLAQQVMLLAGMQEDALQELSRRHGLLRMEPGWIELHLPLHEVDTRLRRAAMDLDPGWLPWLGCVVRFIYG